MPSSGKTTLGKRLARSLHYQFVDTDRQIMREEKRTVAELFAQKGEAYFREAEARVLRGLKPGSNLVVATGGGMPCFHDNMAYIKTAGISVFINVSPADLAARMQFHAQQFPTTAQDRPLFNPADDSLLETLTQKYADRLPTYLMADITLSGNPIEQDILNQLGNWL